MDSVVETVRSGLLYAAIDVEAMFPMAIGFGMLVVVPLTAILLTHQRRMAELVSRRRADEGVEQRVESLEHAVTHLTERVNDITLAIDDDVRARLQPPDRVET
ncbi:MAG: hypothetical protein C4341_02465 [Armatimonadota bacterium]